MVNLLQVSEGALQVAGLTVNTILAVGVAVNAVLTKDARERIVRIETHIMGAKDKSTSERPRTLDK